MSKRAIRRAHKARMIEKAKKIYRYIFKIEDDQQAIKNADHLQSCDCWLCRNPREVFKKPTIQEKRVKQEKIEDLIDEV